MPDMTDRDHFAAAALLGLLASDQYDQLVTPADYADTAYELADAMLRERATTIHDAAPAARASVDSVAPQPTTDGRERTDKSPARTVDGTGESDRPKPIESTPVSHATHREGTERRECTEPVAWAVCTPGDGDWSPCFFHEPHAQRCASAIFGSKNIVPLYRSPTLTEAEREAIDTAAHAAVQLYPLTGVGLAAVLRGLLERLGGER
jgi:hypothetical protein